MHPKKQKILYVITKSNFGGAQRYVFELATAMHDAGHTVSVACGGNGTLTSKLSEAGIPVHTITHFERDINVTKEIGAMRELFQLLKREQPDIVHLNSSKAGGSGALIARLCGVRSIIFTAHGWPFYEPRSVLWRTLVWIFSYLTTLLAHHVIVVSQHDLKRARMPGCRRKLSLIHTGCAQISFLERSQARSALCSPLVQKAHAHDLWLVSTGEHTRNKNIPLLIEALHATRERGDTNLFLILMGSGEDTPRLQKQVSDLQLENQVHFTGFVHDARVYLKAFDIFLMPSLKEGFPYGVLEAGVAGLPVIASAVGGIPEIVHDGETGILINPNEKCTLVHALSTYSTEPDLRRAHGEALAHRVHEFFSITLMIEETQKIYETYNSSPA